MFLDESILSIGRVKGVVSLSMGFKQFLLGEGVQLFFHFIILNDFDLWYLGIIKG